MFPVLRAPHAGAGRQPQRRPAADAHHRHGPALAPAPAHDRRALARPRAERGGRAARGGAAPQGAGHHRDPRRAVGERGAHRRRDRLLHGEGRDPLPRPDQRAARAARRAALGVPRRRGLAWSSPSSAPPWCTSTRTLCPSAGGQRSGRAPPATTTCASRVQRRVEALRRHRGARRRVASTSRAGEILGFLGPNGAGKTTLFDVLSGFQAADRGRGACSTAPRSSASDPTPAPGSASAGRSRTAGCSPPSPCRRRSPSRSSAASTSATRWPPRCTCRRSSTPRRRSPSRVEELIELLGLGAFRDKYVRELSTGSRRVVDLACVLAHGPRVLLLDEPSSGIAQREAEALGPLLLRIRELTGASLLVIEHDVPAAHVDRRPDDRARPRARSSPSARPPTSSATTTSWRRTWENPKQSSLAAAHAASDLTRGSTWQRPTAG